jgi:transposase
LTQPAQQRLVVLNALERGEVVMAEAAALVGLSVRQLRRLRRAYRRRGVKALVHGNRGPPSPRRVSAVIRDRVIRLVRTTYIGVNHRHLTELLAEREDLILSHPTLHRILRAAGYLLLLRQVAATHGVPVAVYTDHHGIFHRSKQTPADPTGAAPRWPRSHPGRPGARRTRHPVDPRLLTPSHG